MGWTVDIAGIRGKFLISPAPGSQARPAADQVRAVPQEGLAAHIRLDGGWAWKGPGHPVDNGDQARGQRDGLRSEGAAQVLFFPRLAGE